MSFSYQAAPLVAYLYYALDAVAVLRGTVAVAAGGAIFGSPPATTNQVAAGVIIATLNGGFTWAVQVRPIRPLLES